MAKLEEIQRENRWNQRDTASLPKKTDARTLLVGLSLMEIGDTKINRN